MITHWQELVLTSHLQTAQAIKDELANGNFEEAATGIEVLAEALGKSEKRALRSQLIRLMTHIIKWKTQPQMQNRSWAGSIENARVEIEELLEFEPSLRPAVPQLIVELFDKAKRVAEKEMGRQAAIFSLTWQDVFVDKYSVM